MHFLGYIRQQRGRVMKNRYSIGSRDSTFCLFLVFWQAALEDALQGVWAGAAPPPANKADVILGSLNAWSEPVGISRADARKKTQPAYRQRHGSAGLAGQLILLLFICLLIAATKFRIQKGAFPTPSSLLLKYFQNFRTFLPVWGLQEVRMSSLPGGLILDMGGCQVGESSRALGIR